MSPRTLLIAAAALALPAVGGAQTAPASAPASAPATVAPQSARGSATVVVPADPRARATLEGIGYSEAVVTGDTVYLSGVVAGPRPGDDGLMPGYERAFRHIARTLQRAGVGWDDVVDITTFHTNLSAHINDFATVKHRHVRAPFPTWTAIGVSSLYEPTAVVEIKVIARKTESPRR